MPVKTLTAAPPKAGNPRGPSTEAQREGRIEDVSVDSLVFASAQKGLSIGVAGALLDGKLEETMHGAAGLTLTMLDRDYAAMQSGLYGTRVIARVDGAAFRLTKPSVVDDWKVSALFEHSLIAEMRENTHPKKARRGSGMTRAEFVLLMLRELKQPVLFVCPELHRKQKVRAPEKIKETTVITDGKAGKTKTTKAKKAGVVTNLAEVGKGPSPGTTITKSPTRQLTSKGVPLTQAQAKIVSQGLEAGVSLHAPKLALYAYVVALIAENNIANPDPGGPGDRGSLSLTDETAHGIQKKTGVGTINPYDITEVAEHFFVAGFAGAGASALARANPSATATHIAYLAQKPAVEYTHAYEAEARAIVDAFLSAGVGGGEAPGSGTALNGEGSNTVTKTTVRTASYEFSRGIPNQVESTFECCLRLAEEVNWRFFVSGRNEVYFLNDEDLLRAAPRYIIKPDSPGLVKLTFDVEVGARTVIVSGKRQPKASEATLIVRADRWAAPPGCVVRLSGWGPADHPWLVDSVERGLFDAETTIQLRAPQHPLEEPRATASGSEPGHELNAAEGGSEGFSGPGTGTRAGTPAAAVEAAKKALSERSKYRYSMGGDRENHGTLFGPAPRTMDCSAFVTLCYKAAGLPDPSHKGYNGIGTTYTMIGHCTEVKNPRPGDLCFYGSRSAPHHVNIYIGNHRTINMGGAGDPKEDPDVFAGFIGYFRPN